MARYSPGGKRLVNKPVRHPVPGELCRDIDVQAARVIKLRQNVRDQERHAGNLGHQAGRVAAAADSAADRGLRKMLHDQADQLRQTAGNAGVRLGKMERTLGESVQALRDLHRTARAYQRGELDEGEGE